MFPRLLTYPEHMKIDSEDEVEDGLISKSIDNTELKKSKAERAEKLRRLMDDEGRILYPYLYFSS